MRWQSMKCVCKQPGIWSQRFGKILCNTCKRRLERGDETIQSPKAEAIGWLRRHKKARDTGLNPNLTTRRELRC